MAKWEIESPEEKETFGQQATRVGLSAGVKALEPIESLMGLLFPNPLKVTPQIKERFGLTPEYMEPRNFGENVASKFIQSAPLAGLLGGAPGLISSGIGALAGGSAAQLGAPESVQDIAQIGSEIASGRVAASAPNTIGKYIKQIPGLSQSIKIESNLAKAAGSNPVLKTAATDISNSIRNVGEALSQETDPSFVEKISKTLNVVSDNLDKGSFTPNDAMRIRKNLYAQGRKMDPAKAAEYIQPLTEGINKFFTNYAAENPTFWKHLNKRDRLNEMKHMRSYVGDWVEENIGSLLGSKAKGEIAKHVGQLGSGIIGGVTGATIGKGEKILRTILTNREGTKYYLNMFKAATRNDPVAVFKNVNNLATLFPGLIPQKSESPSEESSQWIIE